MSPRKQGPEVESTSLPAGRPKKQVEAATAVGGGWLVGSQVVGAASPKPVLLRRGLCDKAQQSFHAFR